MRHLSKPYKHKAIEIIELCLYADSMIEFENILYHTKNLIEYDMMACGIGIRDDYSMKVISYLNNGLPSEFISTIVDNDDGQVISPMFLRWLKTQTPQVLDIQHSNPKFTTEQMAFYQNFNIQNVMSHGVLDCGEHCTSYFGFANIAHGIKHHHIHLMSILVPHLHSAYTRIPAIKQKLSTLIPKQLKITQSKDQDSTLSQREIEVLQWVFIGKTNQEISDTLCLSPYTVKCHVQNIIQKLKANNRQHAVAKALQQGVIKMD